MADNKPSSTTTTTTKDKDGNTTVIINNYYNEPKTYDLTPKELRQREKEEKEDKNAWDGNHRGWTGPD